MSKSTTYQVAVWWPRDGGYGGSTTARSMEAALAEAKALARLGYGYDRGNGEIHIIKTVREVIPWREP